MGWGASKGWGGKKPLPLPCSPLKSHVGVAASSGLILAKSTWRVPGSKERAPQNAKAASSHRTRAAVQARHSPTPGPCSALPDAGSQPAGKPTSSALLVRPPSCTPGMRGEGDRSHPKSLCPALHGICRTTGPMLRLAAWVSLSLDSGEAVSARWTGDPWSCEAEPCLPPALLLEAVGREVPLSARCHPHHPERRHGALGVGGDPPPLRTTPLRASGTAAGSRDQGVDATPHVKCHHPGTDSFPGEPSKLLLGGASVLCTLLIALYPYLLPPIREAV